jgi:hypothetical protein
MFRSFTLFSKSNIPKNIIENSQSCSAFLKINKFKPQSTPIALQHLYGIHRDDINLTVSYTENDGIKTLWRFVSSNYMPRTAYFVNENGQIRLFDFTDPKELNRFTKMDISNE